MEAHPHSEKNFHSQSLSVTYTWNRCRTNTLFCNSFTIIWTINLYAFMCNHFFLVSGCVKAVNILCLAENASTLYYNCYCYCESYRNFCNVLTQRGWMQKIKFLYASIIRIFDGGQLSLDISDFQNIYRIYFDSSFFKMLQVLFL